MQRLFVLCFPAARSTEVMELLIQSSDLFVMQVEMDVYTALKKVRGWGPQKAGLFMFVRRCLSGPPSSASASAVDVPAAQPFVGRPHQAAPGGRRCLAVQTQNRYSRTAAGRRVPPLALGVFGLLKRFRPADLCEKEPFLDTDDGSPFCCVFKHVRLQYIINDLASARILERDNILPPGENRNDETSAVALVVCSFERESPSLRSRLARIGVQMSVVCYAADGIRQRQRVRTPRSA